MALLDRDYYDYYRMSKIKPLTDYEDIKVGGVYHIPPSIIYDRREVIVESKDFNSIRCKVKNSNGEWSDETMYRSELSMRFLVEIKPINNH